MPVWGPGNTSLGSLGIWRHRKELCRPGEFERGAHRYKARVPIDIESSRKG